MTFPSHLEILIELDHNNFCSLRFSSLQVAQYIKITLKDSPHFTVTSNKPTGQKVAPGMEFTCIVHFNPDEDRVRNMIFFIICLHIFVFLSCLFDNCRILNMSLSAQMKERHLLCLFELLVQELC